MRYYSISFVFDERKATQAACYLLSLNGGHMNYMKMIKLLYLSDREYITSYCNSITTDSYVSMDNGPVTSKIYDLIKESHTDTGTYWASYIRTEEYDAVLIKKEEEYLCMSPMEMQVLADVNEKFKEQSVWDVVDFCHKNLKEWQNPAGSTIPISIEDIIRTSTDDSNVKDCIDEMKLAAFVQKSNFYEMRDLRP